MGILDFLFEITETKLNKMIDKKDTKGIIKALQKGKPQIRREAAKALGDMKAGKAVGLLVSILGEEDADLKLTCIESLGKIEDHKAVVPLIECLKDEDVKIRKSATDALKKIGVQAMNPGQKAFYFLASDEWEELQNMGEASVETLVTAIKEGDTQVRDKAAKALENLGDISVPCFIKLLEDIKWYVREISAKALGRLHSKKAIEPLIGILGDENFRVQKKAVWALGELGKDAVEPLLSTFEKGGGRIRPELAEALGKIGDRKPVPALIKALTDYNPRLRSQAATALGNIGDNTAVAPLLDSLNDRESKIRREAAEALGKIRDKRALEHLTRTLQDRDPEIRDTVIKALANLGEAAVEDLITALKYRKWFVREGAAASLGEIGDKRAVEPLIEALSDENDYVRSASAKALGNIGDKRAYRPVLKLLLDGKSGGTRAAAAEAMGGLRDKRAVMFLIDALRDNDSDVKEKAAIALGKMGEPAVEGLIETIKLLANSDIRAMAVNSLGNIGDHRAVVPLFPMLRDRNPRVRKKAAEALGKIPDPRAIGHIIKACEGEFLDKISGAKALERIFWANKTIKDKHEEIICSLCYCRFSEYSIKTPLFNDNRKIFYHACRGCGSGQYFENTGEVVAYLDNTMEKKDWQTDGKLYVNWFKIKEPFDFDSVIIANADEYEVEEFIMKIRNDMDETRLDKLKKMTVTISKGCQLPQLKINLLRETFDKVNLS